MTEGEWEAFNNTKKREWTEKEDIMRYAFLFQWDLCGVITPLIETRKKFKLEIEYEPEQRTKYRITMDDASNH